LVISEFLEGGDLKADENGDAIEGSAGDHAGHFHHGHHGHHHGHGHEHREDNHGHDHGSEHHQHHAKGNLVPDGPHTPSVRKSGNGVVVPQFTIERVKEFLTEAGFVDVDVWTMEEKAYLEIAKT
jgi:hypothetical protein